MTDVKDGWLQELSFIPWALNLVESNFNEVMGAFGKKRSFLGIVPIEMAKFKAFWNSCISNQLSAYHFSGRWTQNNDNN